MTDISPALIAFADQRIASAAQYIDEMLPVLRSEGVPRRDHPDDAVAVLGLSGILLAAYRATGGPPGAVHDALALALRRLAAM